LIINVRRKDEILEEGKDKRMWIGKEKQGVKLGEKNCRKRKETKLAAMRPKHVATNH
jgi:hypothetical protein